MNILEIKKCKRDAMGYYLTDTGKVMLGNAVTLGDGVSSADLNNMFLASYKKQATKHVFCKWEGDTNSVRRRVVT